MRTKKYIVVAVMGAMGVFSTLPASAELPATPAGESGSADASKQRNGDFLSEGEAGRPSELVAQSEASSPPSSAPQYYEQVITVPDVADSASAPLINAPAGRGIEEIVVTARRTAESMQDVPVAVSAMSADDLRRESIGTTQDMQGRIPSLSISAASQGRNTESPTLRGQGAAFGSGPGVAIYFAEVPLPADPTFNGQGGPGKYFDVSSLQVLKGSQGTLFGRNTTGGALLLDPTKPRDDFEASLMAEGTNYSGRGYEAMLNMPVVADTLLARIGFKYVDRGGFTTDVARNKDIDDKHFWTGRLGLTWRPSDRVENYLLGYYTDSEDNGTGAVIEGFNRSGLNYGLLAIATDIAGLPRMPQAVADTLNVGCLFLNIVGPSSNCGGDVVAEQQSRDIRHVDLSTDTRDAIKTGGLIDHINFELSDRITLRNIASYSFFEHHVRLDQDGSRIGLEDVVNDDQHNVGDISQITEELQLQGRAFEERLTYVVGGYYQKVRPEGFQGEYLSALGITRDRLDDGITYHGLLGEVFNALSLTRPVISYGVESQSYAAYGQGTYNLGEWFDSLEGLSFTGGLRFTKDEVSGFSNAGSSDESEFHTADLGYSAVTWTAGLDYKTDTGLTYAKISRGYKAGGFAVLAVVPGDFTYKPEYVLNYEIGNKIDFDVGGAPVRINSAAYYTEYTNMQRTALDSLGGINFGGAIFTADKAAIKGFELEATVRPLDGVTLAATYAFTDAEYKDYELTINQVNPVLDCTGNLIETGNVAELSCLPFQYSPRNQASLTAIFDWPVNPRVGDISSSLTYAWTDDQYSTSYTLPEQEPGAWLKSFGLLNASLYWGRIYGSSFDLRVFGTNLTDEEYRISNSNTWTSIYFRASIYGEPRIFGAQLTYRWGG